MTSPHVHMRMHYTLFCLKRRVISFVCKCFVYKLIEIVVYNVQTKAKLLITENDWLITAFNVFCTL